MHQSIEPIHEKKQVALNSVFAAVFLTISKIVIGVFTGSLGILSEALHSALDLVATIITYFSVRYSDKPADSDHNYGHGKVENFSALVETFLLLITCVWIIYEAVNRLVTGEVHILISVWSYAVVCSSIAIDFTRSRALRKAAIKHNSQALEADALHFSTDIWSSFVVLAGLIFANFGWHTADSIAALFVALIVTYVAIKLGKRSADVLMDKAPSDKAFIVDEIVKNYANVTKVHDIKIRNAGADIFIELSIHVDPKLTIEESHRISHDLERLIDEKIKHCHVHIHEEPESIEQDI